MILHLTAVQPRGDMSTMEREIVHQHEGQWWFWDSSWSERHGPYISRFEAERALQTYIEEILGEQSS